MQLGKTISRYLIQAILPYFGMSWLILTAILFIQQAGRYSDTFFNPNLPSVFVWQLAIALIPNVIAFTCPMAALVGVMIGLSRMQADNELVAIRAAGIGNFATVMPILALGAVLAVVSIAVNIFGVPLASRAVRSLALQTAVQKLESPIEPGVFNTEVAGLTIYAKGGDLTDGYWKNVFVYTEDVSKGESRLITSKRGRIDSQGQNSELVLEDAVVSTLKTNETQGNVVSENIGDIRIAIKTRRNEMLGKLNTIEPSIEELGIAELSRYARVREGGDRTEAEILIVRRVVLAIAPIVFCMLGAAIVLRFSRRGRGFGTLLSLATLLGYFLLTFAGEQLSRAGSLPVLLGGTLPMFIAIAAIIILGRGRKLPLVASAGASIKNIFAKFRQRQNEPRAFDILLDLTTGIRDFEFLTTILKYFALSFGFLAGLFLVFTGFELWRHAASIDNGSFMLASYLIFLIPYIYLQIAPTAAMIAIVATLSIKSRQNEVVTWMAAGQSIYRLLFPLLLLMLVLGIFNFSIQETIVPQANVRQDAIRLKIRSRGLVPAPGGKYWIATDQKIFSFELSKSASDNERSLLSICSRRCALQNVMIYEFPADRAELQSVYRISDAILEGEELKATGTGEKFSLGGERFDRTNVERETIKLGPEFALNVVQRPSHMTIGEIRERIDRTEADSEKRRFAVALERRYTTLLLPFIVGLFTAPFALGLDRKGRVVSIAYAVALWLVFVTANSFFEQLGLNGMLPPSIAVWSPLVLFAMLGIYLLSKVRT